MVSGLALSSDDSLVLNYFLFKSYGNHIRLLGVAYLWDFKDFVDNRFPRVIKSSIDKLLNKLVKNVIESAFSKLCIL